MTLADKDFVMAFLGMKRLRLSQNQLLKIERVIDGLPLVEERKRNIQRELPYVAYSEVMELIGFKSLEGIRKLAKRGELELYRPQGRKQALGVSRTSLERWLQRRGMA